MAKVMVTIRTPGGKPTLEDVRARFDLAADALDERFGVVAVDPDAHAYTVLVEQEMAARIQPGQGWEVEGPFANPRIAPFGPPR